MSRALRLIGGQRAGQMPTTVVAILSLAAAALAAASVAAAPDDPKVPVALIGGLGVAAAAFVSPLAMVGVGVVVIPLEGYFPGLVGPSQAILGVAALAWAARWAAKRPLRLRGHPILGAFAMLMVVEAAGLIFAPEPFVVLRQVVTWGTLLIVAAAISHSASETTLERILFCVVLSGGLAGAVAIVNPQPLVGAVFEGGDVNRATGGLGSPNALGMLLGLMLPIQAVFALRARVPAQRVIAMGCATLALLGMSLSVSRGAFIGVGAAVFVLAAWRPFRNAAVIAAPLVLVLSLVGHNPATPIGNKVIERLGDKQTNGSTNPRVELWRKTPRMIAEHPLFGVGALEFTHYAPEYNLQTSEGIPNHAHDLFLTLAAETGVLGLAAFLAMYGAIISALLRVIRLGGGLGQALGVGLLASFAAFLVNGVLDYALGGAPIAAAFFVLVGCAAGLANRTREATQAREVGLA